MAQGKYKERNKEYIELKLKLKYYYTKCKEYEKEIARLKYRVHWAEWTD